MDRLQSMRVLERVVNEGGFAAAARALALTPPAVTRLVDDLEQALGVRLLHRTTRRLSPTQAGDMFLERIRPILQEIDDVQELVKAQAKDMTGALRIVTMPSAAVNLVSRAVADFQREHPGIRAEIKVVSAPEEEIEHHDVAFVRQDAKLDPDVIVRPVFASAMILCATPAYLRTHGAPREPAGLAAHRVLCVRVLGARASRLRLVNPADGGRAVDLEVNPVIASNDLDTVMEAALDGAGLCLFPEVVCAAALREGRLQRVLQPWMGADKLSLLAALPSRRFTPARTRAFLDFFAKYAAVVASGEAGPSGSRAAAVAQASRPLAVRRTQPRLGQASD